MPMDSALSGLTIIEAGGGVATRYCGHLFAAHGATVLQAGSRETTGVGYGGAGSEAYARWLDAGKLTVEGELSAALGKTGNGADLVIAGQDDIAVGTVDATLKQLGLGDVLRLGVTWFARQGPYRHWAGSDAVIQAMSAVAYATGAKDGAPMLPRGHAPQVIGGATAFIAALGAILGKQNGWRGSRIDVNILEANLCLSESGAAGAALTGDRTVRRGINRFTPTFPGGIYQASDGWIGVTALTVPQWRSLCGLIGRPELAKNPHHFVALQRMGDADELDKVLIPAFKTKPKVYWLEEGQRQRIPMAPVPDLNELPQTPHWHERGSFAVVAGVKGAVAPSMPFHATVLPPVDAQRRTAKTAPELPLAGVRVLDLTMGWAGPLAARHFADLGADVVKVESCAHFDWWRGFDGSMEGDPPPYETRPSFLMVNRNKRGITLDLKFEAGKALTRRLAAGADLVIENYAPGVLDKLGVGAKALTAEKADLIYVQMGAFGAKGPWHSFRAYGSTVEQASGLPFVNGEANDPPTMQHVAYGDPIAGIYGAIAGLIALAERNKRNTGAVIDLGQVECLFQLCADAIVAQSVQAGPLGRDGSRHPLSALRTVVATSSPLNWIALSVETATQWNALAALIGRPDLGVGEAASIAAMKARETEMERAVAAAFAKETAAKAVARLQAARVPAGQVYAGVDLLDDPQLIHDGFWRRAERRFIGNHVVPHAPYLLDGQRPPLNNPSPTLGEHNASVLGGDLGLSEDELHRLADDRIIGTRAILEILRRVETYEEALDRQPRRDRHSHRARGGRPGAAHRRRPLRGRRARACTCARPTRCSRCRGRARPPISTCRGESSPRPRRPAATPSIRATASSPSAPISPRPVRDAGLTFVGPAGRSISSCSATRRARGRRPRAADVPVIRGIDHAVHARGGAAFFASLGGDGAMIIKALAGGGGRGTRVVTSGRRDRDDLRALPLGGQGGVRPRRRLCRGVRHRARAMSRCRSSAISDRRHRPSRRARMQRAAPLPEAASRSRPRRRSTTGSRREIIAAAVRLAKSVGYSNLGTFEFLVDVSGRKGAQPFVFIEANARLQVEHTVTEAVTGVDLVQSQIRLAQGRTLKELGLDREGVATPRGYAIQARVNMETIRPDGAVRPGGGTLTVYEAPNGPGVRTDGFGYAGYQTSSAFDSLLAKVIAHSPSPDFADAVSRLTRALSEFRLEGVATNIAFLRNILGA